MAARYWSIVLAAALAGCGGGGGAGGASTQAEPAGPDEAKLVPACFQAPSALPVLGSDDLFAGSTWNDPSVLRVGNRFVMYASSDLAFDGDIKLYRLTSADGSSWTLDPATPVFEAAGAGNWDGQAVETPSVVHFQGAYHLFYTGYAGAQGDTAQYKIGHAISPDGIAWTRDPGFLLEPTDPGGAPNLDFHQYIVAEPGAVVFKDRLFVYFTALGADAGLGTTLQVIGVVSSADGVSWSVPRVALAPDQTLYPRSGNYKGYSTPAAAVVNDRVHLFYDVVTDTPFEQVKLHHAVSRDGVGGWTEDAQEIYDRAMFAWTADEIRAPSPLLAGTTLYLWFAGHQGTTLGVGLAACDLSG